MRKPDYRFLCHCENDGWWIRSSADDKTNKTIANRHGIHLFGPGNIVGRRKLNREIVADIDSNQVRGVVDRWCSSDGCCWRWGRKR